MQIIISLKHLSVTKNGIYSLIQFISMKLIVILLSSILISPIVKAGDSIARELMSKQAEDTISIPIHNNGYTTPRSLKEDDEFITSNGLASWSDTSLLTKVYFIPSQKGKVMVSLQLNEVQGTSKISIGLAGTNQKIIVAIHPAQSSKMIQIGEFTIVKEGYNAFNIKGIAAKEAVFPSIQSIIVNGSGVANYRFNKSNYRGAASTHLRYQVPADTAVKWFYTEVKVPNEVANSVHAYYETNGFHSGYGGIQINSLTERRFIFSIWSKFKTDDPTQIPSEYAVNLKRKGAAVFTGEFGNEGSGGHSHLVFPWKTNTTYHFLTGIKSIKGDSATYVGYYAAPEDHYTWHVLSEWTQNKTDTKTGFKNLYAFVENFGPNGDDYFKAYYGNQWAVTFNGTWIELNTAKFTTTAGANKHQRYDYGAGVEGNQFYMYSGGFKTLNNINAGDIITRPITQKHPSIAFNKLL